MDPRVSQYEIIGKDLASRPGDRRRRIATAFGVRPLLLLMMMAFCVGASARAQQAGPGGTTEGVVRGQPASNDEVPLAPEERQWLSQHDGMIRIGITVIPPQVLRENGKYQGLAIDYIRLMERKLRCRFELVPYATWNEVIQAAKERQIDMIFAAQQTPERLTYLLFTEPYIELPNMILVSKDRPGGSSLKDMKGWSVAASEGSAVHEYLKKEFAYLDLRPVPDELSGLMKVSIGEVDAMVVEISRASYYIEKAGILNLRVAGNAGLLYQLRFAVRNDWPVLRGILDQWLASITEEERRDIGQRWIVVGERSIFVDRAFWISSVAGLGAITLTVVGVLLWNRTLRRIVRQRTSQLQQELAERNKAEESLHRLNRELRAIRNCNQVLVRAEDEQSLLGDVCRIVCEEAGYRMAWVGYADNDEAKTVRPVAWGGVEEGYLVTANITWADTERGRGPTGTAIRNGESMRIQDFTTDPQAAPWRDSALQRGYRSSIALPLKDESAKTFGALTIYATKPNAYTPDEIRLLEELSGDLAFGIMVLRARIERKRFEQELKMLNITLKQRVQEELAKNREKEHLLIQQSRLAAMGEMVGNIAHQWRQPLNALALLLSNIKEANEFGELNDDYLEKSIANGHRFIKKMSTTINDFRNFFRPDKESAPFSALEQINEAISIVDASFKNNNVALELNAASDLRLQGFPNEYSQVLLNLLANAKEAIHARHIATGRVMILLDRVGDFGRVSVTDNGGGIPENIADKIFEPYFSTKAMGTGIGLYMSKMIIEHNMNGRLSAHNIDAGAEFVIEIPLADEVVSSKAAEVEP